MRAAGRPTVMVAHNHEDARSLLRFWLDDEGYDVVEAADGHEVIELTRGECPDLILMSERMPKLGGLETARRIRQHDKGCVFPILILSSFPTAEAHAAAVNAGCDSFIHEPVDFDLLGELIGRLLHAAARERRAAARPRVAASP